MNRHPIMISNYADRDDAFADVLNEFIWKLDDLAAGISATKSNVTKSNVLESLVFSTFGFHSTEFCKTPRKNEGGILRRAQDPLVLNNVLKIVYDELGMQYVPVKIPTRDDI